MQEQKQQFEQIGSSLEAFKLLMTERGYATPEQMQTLDECRKKLNAAWPEHAALGKFNGHLERALSEHIKAAGCNKTDMAGNVKSACAELYRLSEETFCNLVQCFLISSLLVENQHAGVAALQSLKMPYIHDNLIDLQSQETNTRLLQMGVEPSTGGALLGSVIARALAEQNKMSGSRRSISTYALTLCLEDRIEGLTHADKLRSTQLYALDEMERSGWFR